VVTVAQKLSLIEERLQDQRCLLQTGDYRNKGHNSGKLSCIRFLMKKLSVDQKINMTEEWLKEKSCLLQREN
jgi:hypothetical protein